MATAEPADEEDYHSSSDEDFAPNALPAGDADSRASSSESEDLDQTDRPRKRRKTKDEVAETLGYDNSGDEAIIKRTAKKKQKRGRRSEEAEDEGGEGGLIKTRAQRKAETRERKPLAEVKKSAVDVNALWAQMASPAGEAIDETKANDSPLHNEYPKTEALDSGGDPNVLPHLESLDRAQLNPKYDGSSTASSAPDKTVVIKRKYEFAGQVMEEEKTVSVDSAEAKLFEEEQKRATQASNGIPQVSKNRPMRRKGLFGVGNDKGDVNDKDKAKTKLNTLEKSKLDWAAHVDKEGLSQELDEASRAKGAYLNRLDFLGRMDVKRDDRRPG